MILTFDSNRKRGESPTRNQEKKKFRSEIKQNSKLRELAHVSQK